VADYDDISIYAKRDITGADFILAHNKRLENGLGFCLVSDSDELISLSVEYAYGDQFWEDTQGTEGVCCCDRFCNGNENKTRIRMPFAFSNPRPVTEWTEEYIRSAVDIPELEKDEIIEYITGPACLKQVAPESGASIFFAEADVSSDELRAASDVADVFTLSWSDGVGGPVEDIWKDDLAEVAVFERLSDFND
jgi:hypothetical protein